MVHYHVLISSVLRPFNKLLSRASLLGATLLSRRGVTLHHFLTLCNCFKHFQGLLQKSHEIVPSTVAITTSILFCLLNLFHQFKCLMLLVRNHVDMNPKQNIKKVSHIFDNGGSPVYRLLLQMGRKNFAQSFW